MNKLILCSIIAVGLCGCENETTVSEAIKQTVVHDTIVEYKTHECSQEYGVDAEPVNGNTYIFEIHSKRTDKIVFYLQPIVIWNQITKAGGKTTIAESDMCKHWGNQHIIGCYVEAIVNGKGISFYKEWPDSEFYLVETYSIGLSHEFNTVNFIPSTK